MSSFPFLHVTHFNVCMPIKDYLSFDYFEFPGTFQGMDFPKESNTVNKTIHLTGIGLAVQAFYINLTLDSILGHEYLQMAPVGPVSINPGSIWKINGVPVKRDSSIDQSGVPDKISSAEKLDKVADLLKDVGLRIGVARKYLMC